MPEVTVNHISGINRNNVESFSFILASLFCVVFGFVLCFTPETAQPSRLSFDNKININSAPAASLIRLSGIGSVRAEAIVRFREKHKQADSDVLVFKNAEDLQQVKGIGPGTVENTREWLKFE